jgi:uncharacterized membrane protein
LAGTEAGMARVASVGLGAIAWPTLAGLGAGVGVVGILNPDFVASLGKSRASMDFARAALLGGAIGVVVSWLVIALLARFIRGHADEPFGERFRPWGFRAAGLAGAPLVVWLQNSLERKQEGLVFAFVLLATILASVSAYHLPSPGSLGGGHRRISQRIAVTTLAALTLYFVWKVSGLAIAHHQAFQTGRADLGIYMTIFRHSSLGIPLGCSFCTGGNHLIGHFDPILVLLSPLYLIYPYSETLLVLQTLWLASTVVPAYLISKHHLGNPWFGVVLGFAFLASPGLHGVALFDFHSVALCVPLFVWLLYFFETGRLRWYAAMAFVVLLVREDMPLALACVGVYAFFSGKPLGVRVGWLTVIGSVAYFVLVKFVIVKIPDPLNRNDEVYGYAHYYRNLIPRYTSTGGLVATLFGDPVFVLRQVFKEPKVYYALQLLAPVLLLPLLARGRLMLAYGSVITLLATRAAVYSTHFQYSSLLLPFVVLLTPAGLARVRSGELRFGALAPERLGRAMAVGMVVSSALVSWKFGAIVPNDAFRAGFGRLVRQATSKQRESAEWLKRVADGVDREESIAAAGNLLPHLGSALKVVRAKHRRQADYFVVPNFRRGSKLRKTVEKEVRRGHLEKVDEMHGMRLYRTKYPPELRAKLPQRRTWKENQRAQDAAKQDDDDDE